MSKIQGCDLPEDLYYLIDKHVWAKPMGDGIIRVGMTTVATKLAGGSFAAVTVSAPVDTRPMVSGVGGPTGADGISYSAKAGASSLAACS